MNATASEVGFGSSILTGSQLAERFKVRNKVEKTMRRRLRPKRSQQPSLQSVALVVCWAFAYAEIEGNPPLDEKNPHWPEFFAYSEWFRYQIIKRVGCSKNVTWDEIARMTGFMNEQTYKNLEEYYEHHFFGEMLHIDHPCAKRMLRDLEEIKFSITGRV